MRLIDADYAEKMLRSLGNRAFRRENGTIMDAIKMISNPSCTPTVDAVEVVRCKDCKHCCTVCGAKMESKEEK